jgi:F-type H+-transporting ATPase subunit b
MLRLSLFLFPLLAFAAEEGDHAASELTYKWINFAILAAALGYLIVKYMLPALKTRASVIQQDLAESAATVQKAEAQVAQLTARLGNFDGEIASIRSKAMAEREAEAKRIAAQTEALLAKVHAQREVEISNYTQVGEAQLRAFTIEKALELAQSRLATQTDPATQGALVTAFVAGLARQEAN